MLTIFTNLAHKHNIEAEINTDTRQVNFITGTQAQQDALMIDLCDTLEGY